MNNKLRIGKDKYMPENDFYDTFKEREENEIDEEEKE